MHGILLTEGPYTPKILGNKLYCLFQTFGGLSLLYPDSPSHIDFHNFHHFIKMSKQYHETVLFLLRERREKAPYLEDGYITI